MCTRGKLFWLGRSVGCSKSLFQQKFHLAPLYKHRPRPYAALYFKKMDSSVQNTMNTRAYGKDASKQSSSLISGLKGTASALVNQFNGVLDMWGLLGQLMRQPRKPNSLDLCLEEQHWDKELEKSKKAEEDALRAEEDRKQKIWDDALLLSKDSNKDLEKCCQKLAADKKKKEAEKKKMKALEKCCKKLAEDKKKKELEACCKKLAKDKKKKKKNKKKDC